MENKNTNAAKIEEMKMANGSILRFVRLGLDAGKRMFLALGFSICQNKNYLISSDGDIAHFNATMKVWVIE